MTLNTLPETVHSVYLTAEALAASLGIKPQTLRANLCRNGHYFGIRPIKTPNRFLLWPADSVERLIKGEQS